MDAPFKNRKEAGVLLARRLMGYAGRTDVIVLALPRGEYRWASRLPPR